MNSIERAPAAFDGVAAAAVQGGPRRITVLGSTGSVGQSTLDLVVRNRENYRIVALTAGTRVKALVEQARLLRPEVAVIADERLYADLKEGLSGTGVEAAAGPAAVSAAAAAEADWTMSAIVGSAGLEPTLSAIRRGGLVAFANKETLVCGGGLVIDEVRRHGARLLPVDSEHNAIFQVLDAERPEGVEKIVLTASGGPFRQLTRAQMAKKTPAEAVAHPNWDMGAKISVDSATMMNKGLEVIEAHYLFQLPSERIEVLVHPQSVIHSMVAYRDGSVLAQLGTPDMRTPIAHTLAWPARMAAPVATLDLAAIGQLTFEQPDDERFPALRLARTALESGGRAPLLLNAANEVGVAAFLAGRIGFLEIMAVIEETLAGEPHDAPASLDEVLAADRSARAAAERSVARLAAA